MPIWDMREEGEINKDVLFTCSCGETQNQLQVIDWNDLIILSISDRTDGFFRRLWNFLKRGRHSYMEIVFRQNEALALAKELERYADKPKPKRIKR